MVIRGHQRQSHLEGGGVDDRHQLATACIEGRASAHRTARERVDEFGLLILRVGKGSCNQRSSKAIKSRVSAIRGRHGRSEPIRVSERQSRDSHMQSCGNQRQPKAIGRALRCNQEAIRGHQRPSVQLTCQSGSASSPPSSSSPASTCGKRRGRHGEHLHAEARTSRGSAAPRAPRLPRGVCNEGGNQHAMRFSIPASTAASPGRSLRSSSRSRSPMVVPDSLSRWSAGE